MPLTLLLLWLQEKHCKCFNQFSSVTHSCPALCDPMDSSTPGFPVHHQLPEPTQSHVLWVGDVIQPSHPLSSPSPPAFNLSQYQGLFKWVSSSHQVAKVRSFNFNISLLYKYVIGKVSQNSFFISSLFLQRCHDSCNLINCLLEAELQTGSIFQIVRH